MRKYTDYLGVSNQILSLGAFFVGYLCGCATTPEVTIEKEIIYLDKKIITNIQETEHPNNQNPKRRFIDSLKELIEDRENDFLKPGEMPTYMRK